VRSVALVALGGALGSVLGPLGRDSALDRLAAPLGHLRGERGGRAREAGLAGATVLRGVEGFGAHSRLHSAKVLRLSEDLPILIELVDREDRIRAFLPLCDEMIGEGMITLEPVEVLKYQAPPPAGS